MRHRVTWLDVFTSTPLTGNGLAVVHGADDLDDATMLRIARETDLSETAFVQAPAAPGADYRNRIYTTMGEIPFAGHPSLGVAVAVAREKGLREAHFVQQTDAGLQPLHVQVDGDRARASMLQEPARVGAMIDASIALAALGLKPDDGHPAWPTQPVSTGIFHLMIPLRDRDALNRVQPDFPSLQALTAQADAVVLYPFVVDEADGVAHARGFFEGPHGVIEDPATGSAAGPLCAYLASHAGRTKLTVHQGVALGRPSRLDAELDGDRVRVSGDCVVVLEGDLLL